MRISFSVNERFQSIDIDAQHTLLDVLRDDIGLTGTKECCLVGECGVCTVRLNDRIVDSCLVLAVEADGGSVVTVEGLAREVADHGVAPLQAAFLEHGAVQCGFCIPGQLMAGDDILRRHAHPTRAQIEEGIAGNLCRCGCYYQIVDAIAAASKMPRDADSGEQFVASDAVREMPPHVVDQ